MGIRSFALFLSFLMIFGFCGPDAVRGAEASLCFSMRGDRGSEVRGAKEKLAALGYFKGDEDDCFDEALYEALRAYQKAHEMRETGLLSTGVLAALGVAEEAGAVSEADLLLLCDLLYDVCRGKSYITMTCVASAVVNRAKDPRFEDGIGAAVYALRQANGIPAPSGGGETPEFLICRAAYEALRLGPSFPGVYFFLQAGRDGLFADISPVFSFEGLAFYGV